MITSYKELRFYILADRMMNTGGFRLSLFSRIKLILGYSPILDFLGRLRHVEFYDSQAKNGSPFKKKLFNLLKACHQLRLSRLGRQLGFTIYPHVLDYGVSIPHWGTVVVGPGNKIGRYAVFHTCTCIPGGDKKIGDYLYVATGAKITKDDIILGDNITVAANSVCTKDCPESNVLLAGAPATVKAPQMRWTDRDGVTFTERVRKIEELKEKWKI